MAGGAGGLPRLVRRQACRGEVLLRCARHHEARLLQAKVLLAPRVAGKRGPEGVAGVGVRKGAGFALERAASATTAAFFAGVRGACVVAGLPRGHRGDKLEGAQDPSAEGRLLLVEVGGGEDPGPAWLEVRVGALGAGPHINEGHQRLGPAVACKEGKKVGGYARTSQGKQG